MSLDNWVLSHTSVPSDLLAQIASMGAFAVRDATEWTKEKLDQLVVLEAVGVVGGVKVRATLTIGNLAFIEMNPQLVADKLCEQLAIAAKNGLA